MIEANNNTPIVATSELDAIMDRVVSLRERSDECFRNIVQIMDLPVLSTTSHGVEAKNTIGSCQAIYNSTLAQLQSIEQVHCLATALRRVGRSSADQKACANLIDTMNANLADLQMQLDAADETSAKSMVVIAKLVQAQTTVSGPAQ